MRFFKIAQKWSGTVFHGGADAPLLDSPSESATGNPTAVWGTFFTPDEKEAIRYVHDFHDGKGRVHHKYVELERPYYMTFAEYESFVRLDLSKPTEAQMDQNHQKARKFKEKLVEKGFDGIVIGKPGVLRSMEIVAFSPASIHEEKTAKTGGDLVPFREIQKKAKEKGVHHHLKLICDKCGLVETCRCPAKKTEVHGICWDCEHGTPKDKRLEFLAQTYRTELADAKYPKAGPEVSGFKVGYEIPNQDSIAASLTDYKILPGIREIPLSEFDESRPYSKEGWAKVRRLMSEIGSNKRIDPLIVVVDQEGAYVLEGGHRLAALQLMKVEKMPAMVVVELQN